MSVGNMYLQENKYKLDQKEIGNIVVKLTVKGFRSKEEAERFINNVCKKTAPEMEYSVVLSENSNINLKPSHANTSKI